jgi:hypothetical protein
MDKMLTETCWTACLQADHGWKHIHLSFYTGNGGDCSYKVLLMMDKMLTETCWAAYTQLNNKIFYKWVCIWLVVLFVYLKMHGTTNNKFSYHKSDALLCCSFERDQFALSWERKTKEVRIGLHKFRLLRTSCLNLRVQLFTGMVDVFSYRRLQTLYWALFAKLRKATNSFVMSVCLSPY